MGTRRSWALAMVLCTTAIGVPALLLLSPSEFASRLGSSRAEPEPLMARDTALEQRALGSPLGQRYQELLQRHRARPAGEVASQLTPAAMPADLLSFDPSKALYFSRIERELQLTLDEVKVFAEQGLVSVDHQQRYSMGSAYEAIYARDLPLLITTDSILHALHRSFDQTLKELEVGEFTGSLRGVLSEAERELARARPELERNGLRPNADDLGLYLGVARRLLEGPGAVLPTSHPQHGQILSDIDGLQAKDIEIFGGERGVDFSQFRPRGHYAETPELQRYFRALSWLGRADLAFLLAEPAADSGLRADVARERTNAALLSLLATRAKQAEPLAAMSRSIDYLVGRGDGVSVAALAAALSQAGITSYSTLADKARLDAAFARIDASAGQLIRSQAIVSPDDAHRAAVVPSIFQLFGQRFTPDGFVLSQVVYDSIQFENEKPGRWMPSGLDVMAALGSSIATQQLKPELERYHYAPNLLALREALESEVWSQPGPNLYVRWLDALRRLDDVPEAKDFPEVMRRPAWQHKQLQTQLASWAELRHDTLLYAKQSYTSVPSCGYPAAYVEPYPEFYRRVREIGEGTASFLASMQAPQAVFWRELAATLQRLETIAGKELAGELPTDEERTFLARTIRAGGGSGPPRYSGWYAQLIYRPGWQPSSSDVRGFGDAIPERDQPDAWRPTVADVHTNPGSDFSPPEVLEVGVGDVEFVVVAIERQGDVTAYVGPISSYYEFKVPPEERLDDAAWQARIQADQLPERPAFTALFRAPAQQRALNVNYRFSGERKRALEDKICKMRALWAQADSEQAREAWRQHLELSEQALAQSDRALARETDPPADLPTDPMLDARLAALDDRPFDAKTARERLLARAPALQAACGALWKATGPLRVRVTFDAPDGAVGSVEPPAQASKALAECAERILSRTWAPRFGGPPSSLAVDFSLHRPHAAGAWAPSCTNVSSSSGGCTRVP